MHATIADVIADTAQNSIEAGASRIEVRLDESSVRLAVSIVDNGKGMDAATQQRAFDPFYTEPGKHDRRKVGLGLPILRQLCDDCGGHFALKSEPGKGTHLDYDFDPQNIDLPPLGDVAELVLGLFNYPGDFELVFTHRREGGEYTIARRELAEAVGSLEDIESLALAREFLRGQEAELPPEVAR